jgi:hypothetical protein
MSLYRGEIVWAKENFRILSSHQTDDPPRKNFHVDFKKGDKLIYTGKAGACLLPDGSIVPGIEVIHGRNHFVPYDKVCFKLLSSK